MKRDRFRIVFMGTPEFAVPALDKLIKSGYNVVGVVTAPDKPAGRGKKILTSAVKNYAVQNNIPFLQPEKLKDALFISKLRDWKPDLQIVVAFRMLPEIVWSLPVFGTINLHASLLPQYRGAAPINHVLINGEKETGLTTFFLDKEIDTGAIIQTRKIEIQEHDDAGSLHDRMMILGADLLIDTVEEIFNKRILLKPQSESILQHSELKAAPKITKEFCRINWKQNAGQVVNFIRGLSPYPTAFSEFTSDDNESLYLKIFSARAEPIAHSIAVGSLITDQRSFLKISVPDGFVILNEIQQAGKNRVDSVSFLRGFSFKGSWKSNDL